MSVKYTDCIPLGLIYVEIHSAVDCVRSLCKSCLPCGVTCILLRHGSNYNVWYELMEVGISRDPWLLESVYQAQYRYCPSETMVQSLSMGNDRFFVKN